MAGEDILDLARGWILTSTAFDNRKGSVVLTVDNHNGVLETSLGQGPGDAVVTRPKKLEARTVGKTTLSFMMSGSVVLGEDILDVPRVDM